MKKNKNKASIYIVLTTVIIMLILLVIICVNYEKDDENKGIFGIDPNEITNKIKEEKEQISSD